MLPLFGGGARWAIDMITILAIEPATFQTIIMAWAAAVFAVIIGISIGLTRLAPYIADIIAALKSIKEQILANEQRLDRHGIRIDNNTKEITSIAKQMPPTAANCP